MAQVKRKQQVALVTGAGIVVDGGQHLWPRSRDVQFDVEKG
jgi:hypothetical protein